MTDNILDALNDAQRQAVVYNDGPQLVIAGAGSGKTRVLTYKIAYLLREGCDPWNILALTFTNKAAKEMKQRIGALVGTEIANRLYMGTFHSIFARILRIEAVTIGYQPNFTIYDETDSRSLIKRIIKDMMLDDKKYKPGVVHNVISMAKNHLITALDYANDESALARDRDMQMPMIYKIYEAYSQRCKQANAMDFDDLLLETFSLFSDNDAIRRKYEARFHYILVDEYQDTNNVQQRIVRLLSMENPHVCVVGDDSQSIYSFRGANIDNILDFQNQYDNVRLFKLEQNYRSTKLIVKAANSLIKHNQKQIPKDVYSNNGAGEKLIYKPTYSDKEEAAVVCRDIMRLRSKDHYGYGDFAILYRTNAQSRPFEEQLRKEGIPYRIYGGLSFYQRKEIKDVLAYFRLIANPDDEEAFMRIINYPARGIGNTTVGKIQQAARNSGVSLWNVISQPAVYSLSVSGATATKLNNFQQLISSFIARAASEDVFQLAKEVLEETGMKQDIYSSTATEDIARQENIDDFMGSLQDFVEIQRSEGNDTEVGLADYLPTVSLMTDADSDDKGDEDRVSLMTIHSAKGLEFKTVFIVGMEDNIIPSQMSAQSLRGLEEERRLLYVAITRAEDHCILTSAQNRFRYGKTEFDVPSRFLYDIDPSLMNVQGGGFNATEQSSPRSRFTSGNTPWRERTKSSWRQETQKPQQRRESFHPASASSPSSSASEPTSAVIPAGLRVGATIAHRVFGTGTVKSIEGTGADTKIIVLFRTGETKTLLLKFAKVKVL